MFSGSRRSRKADRSASGPGPSVRRRTAHPTRASAAVSSCTPDKRMNIQSVSRSGPIRSRTNKLRSAASIRANLCRQPSGPRRSRSSSAPIRPATRARRAALPASARHQSSRTAVSRGSALGPGGRESGSSSIGPGKNHRSSSETCPGSSTPKRGSSNSSCCEGCCSVTCAKYGHFANYPRVFRGSAQTHYIVRARDGSRVLYDHAGCVKTKGFLTSRATEPALASVYKRSFDATT